MRIQKIELGLIGFMGRLEYRSRNTTTSTLRGLGKQVMTKVTTPHINGILVITPPVGLWGS